MSKNQKPTIIIPKGRKPWDKEIRIAKILAAAGARIEFLSEISTAKMPDIKMNGICYEIKTPVSNKIDAVERNLERALTKSPNIIFDSSKMRVSDEKIKRELLKRLKIGKGLKRVIFVDKKGRIIDINSIMK